MNTQITSYQEFLEAIQALHIEVQFPCEIRNWNPNSEGKVQTLDGRWVDFKDVKDDPEKAQIEVRWVTGGMTGGNCWTGPADRAREPDPEPEFTDLDKIFEALTPNMSFLQYKKICSECIEQDRDSHSEYYMNSTDYGIKRVQLRRLYDALTGAGLLPKPE